MAWEGVGVPVSRSAIVQDVDGTPQLAQNVAVPALKPGTVLVRTTAVALNPIDYKLPASFPTPGAMVGNDFTGTVVAVAEGLDEDTDLRPGDVVCGGVFGSDPNDTGSGAFASYVRAPAALLFRVPPAGPAHLETEQAATLGTALATCALALWGTQSLDLLPATPEQPAQVPLPVLVYGGSTATGTIAVQLLRLSGLDPIATCSPHNFDLVRSRGASAVFDYTRPDVAAAIKRHTGGRLKHVLDCISDAQSVEICYDAIARVGGRYTCLELVPDELLARRRAVKPSFLMASEVTGEEIKLPGGYGKSADPAKRAAAVSCFAMFQRLLDQGKLRTHPTHQLEGGLESILDGLALLKSGSVSGKKLVARLSE
ncbi:putative zinc-binding dehydrogenase family oxidoreductase [Thozetella sp. PMI_491]|nr:putative zinc-binding dehydrogenase family oxidoreductase [Thozetella sp. PMI_491]